MKVALPLLDRGWIPDVLLRFGTRMIVRQKLKELQQDTLSEERRLAQFAEETSKMAIAINTMDANEQHYEVPSGLSWQRGRDEVIQHLIVSLETSSITDRVLRSLSWSTQKVQLLCLGRWRGNPFCRGRRLSGPQLRACAARRWDDRARSWLWLGLANAVYRGEVPTLSRIISLKFIIPKRIHR
jgi:hypothetical protein